MPDFSQFSIGFDKRDIPRLHELWDGIFDSNRWSEGEFTERFEEAWGAWNKVPSVAFGSWNEAGGSALQLLLNVVLLIAVGAGGLSAQRALWARRYPRERAG